MGRMNGRLAVLAAIFLALMAIPTPAYAAANDDFDAATAITSLPFSGSADFSTATPAADDPTDCQFGTPTAWFAYTAPEDQRVAASVALTAGHGHISAYTGSRGALTNAGMCDQHSGILAVSPGATVYFMVADVFFSGGVETFSLLLAPPLVSVDASINTRATLTRGGTVILTGTVTCNTPAQVDVNGELRQKKGLNIVRGGYGVSVACGSSGIATWSAIVDGGSRAFLVGGATASLNSGGCDSFTCDFDNPTRTVSIKIVRR